MPTYLPVPWTPPQLPVPYQPIPVPQIQSAVPQLPPRMAQPIFPRPMFRAGSIGGAGFAGPSGPGGSIGAGGVGGVGGGGSAGGFGGGVGGAASGPTISSTVTPPPPTMTPPSSSTGTPGGSTGTATSGRASASAGVGASARALPPPTGLPDPPLYGPPPLSPASASRLPAWSTKSLPGSKFGVHSILPTALVHGARGTFDSAMGLTSNDYTSSSPGRILDATWNGMSWGSLGGPVGGVVGGLGAGLGQAGLEGGQAFANTGVGREIRSATDAQSNELARLRESSNPLEKLYGYGQSVGAALQPSNLIGTALNLFSENDLEAPTNVGNLSPTGAVRLDPFNEESNSPVDKAVAQEALTAKQEATRQAVQQQRQARVEASSPENLEFMLNRLPMTPQSRSEITNEYLSQLAVMEEMYRSGGLTVPERVEERDGKMYLSDGREVPKDQVQSVKNGDQEVKVVYRQANDDDLDDMQVDLYQRIVQSVPEVVAADREQTAQMNRMLGYSTALQYALEPYQAQAQQLGATYQQAAGSNPLLAPFAQAFQIGQQGISDAYGAQAAVLPYQIMLEQQAKAQAEAQAAQAEQDALLARQKELERYKKELGASTYQQSSGGADDLSGLNLGG